MKTLKIIGKIVVALGVAWVYVEGMIVMLGKYGIAGYCVSAVFWAIFLQILSRKHN